MQSAKSICFSKSGGSSSSVSVLLRAGVQVCRCAPAPGPPSWRARTCVASVRYCGRLMQRRGPKEPSWSWCMCAQDAPTTFAHVSAAAFHRPAVRFVLSTSNEHTRERVCNALVQHAYDCCCNATVIRARRRQIGHTVCSTTPSTRAVKNGRHHGHPKGRGPPGKMLRVRHRPRSENTSNDDVR